MFAELRQDADCAAGGICLSPGSDHTVFDRDASLDRASLKGTGAVTVSQTRDTYHLFLGIPPEEQPPDHYRLLGLSRFEANASVIDTATSRVATYLHEISTGPDREEIQELLNEVAGARRVLLDRKKRAAYDSVLFKDDSSEPEPTQSEPTPPVLTKPAETVIPSASPPSGQRRKLNQRDVRRPRAGAQRSRSAKRDTRSRRSGKRRPKFNRPVIIGAAVASTALVVLFLVVAFFSDGESETTGAERYRPVTADHSTTGSRSAGKAAATNQRSRSGGTELADSRVPFPAISPEQPVVPAENHRPLGPDREDPSTPVAVQERSKGEAATEPIVLDPVSAQNPNPPQQIESRRGNTIPLPGSGSTLGSSPGSKTGVLSELWDKVPGDDLTSFLDFIYDNPQPNSVRTMSVLADSGTPAGIDDDHWGQRISGCLLPPATGDYSFRIEADDFAVLYLSPTHRLENLRRVSSASTVRLGAGRPVAFVLFFKENTGGELFTVGWRLPNGSVEYPIPGNRLTRSAYGRGYAALLPELCESADGTTTFEILEDARVLATAPPRSEDDFTVTFRHETATVTRIRFEALRHAALPAGGPGFGRSGMFAVEEVFFEIVDEDGTATPVELKPVSALGSTKLAFDGKPETAWQVSTARGRPIQLTLLPKVPLQLSETTQLRLRLQNRTSLGCFRVSITSKTGR